MRGVPGWLGLAGVCLLGSLAPEGAPGVNAANAGCHSITQVVAGHVKTTCLIWQRSAPKPEFSPWLPSRFPRIDVSWSYRCPPGYPDIGAGVVFEEDHFLPRDQPPKQLLYEELFNITGTRTAFRSGTLKVIVGKGDVLGFFVVVRAARGRQAISCPWHIVVGGERT